MLSVPTNKSPRKVVVIVSNAKNIVPSQKEKKKKVNIKFRAVVLGGKKKESSPLVQDNQGNPEWNFKCTIKLKQANRDPVCILIEDSESHHKGQVIIPLVKINTKPYTQIPDQSPGTSTNLICSELEPTSKCPIASGFLYYWIWVEEYYGDGDSCSQRSFNKSISSFFGSKNNLSVPSGSIGNISSSSSLNRPDNSRSMLDIFKMKHKKDKSKRSSPDYRLDGNIGDTEYITEYGMAFDTNKTSENNKNPFSAISDQQFSDLGNPFKSGVERSMSGKSYNVLPDRFDTVSHVSYGSVSEKGLFLKFDDDIKVDVDILKRENSDLKAQNIALTQKVYNLQTELDEVKNTLFKLRTRLLQEGATQFLERQ